jgi:serine/threonine protein kinase
MWSVGVILYIMLTGHPIYSSPADWAFSALARGQLQQLMAFYAAQYGLGVPPLAFDLLAALLDAEPSRRPTLEMVRVHPWVLAHTPGLEHRAADGAPQPAA